LGNGDLYLLAALQDAGLICLRGIQLYERAIVDERKVDGLNARQCALPKRLFGFALTPLANSRLQGYVTP